MLRHDLVAATHDLGMDVLVKVHDREELDRNLPLGTKLVGINNRDLRSIEVSLVVAEALATLVPPDRIVVSESGIGSNADLVRLGRVGVQSFRGGESLMRQANLADATRSPLFV